MARNVYLQLVISILTCTYFLFKAQAVPPQDNTDNALKPFWIVLAGTTNGGCDAHEQDLRVSWDEACRSCRQAQNDINFLLTNANNGQGPNAQTQPNERKRWDRVFGTFIVLFGSPFDGNPANSLLFQQALLFFNNAVSRCSERQENSRKQQAHLYCDDTHLRWIKNGEPDPEDPSKKIEETHPQCNVHGGIWYSEKYPDAFHYRDYEPPEKDGDTAECSKTSGDGGAYTDTGAQVVGWCPKGLESVPSLENLRAQIKSEKARTKVTAKALISMGQITTLYDISGTDKEDMLTFWVHELAHLLLFYDDEGTYDKDGNPLMAPAHVWDESQGKYVDKQDRVKAFTWEDCVNLARKDQEAAVKSPENLANFAKAMFLGDWDWSKGYAQPV